MSLFSATHGQLSIVVGFSLALLGAGCGGGGGDDPQTEAATPVAAASDGLFDARRDDGVAVASFAPITMHGLDRAIPAKRSDALCEREPTNRKADPATTQRLDVLDADGARPPLRGKRYIAGDNCCNSTPMQSGTRPDCGQG